MAGAVTGAAGAPRDTSCMFKLPPRARQLTRKTFGMGEARSIAGIALQALAASERVIVIGVGNVTAGGFDRRLPGEQRTASMLTLASVVADLSREQPIVTHCG